LTLNFEQYASKDDLDLAIFNGHNQFPSIVGGYNFKQVRKSVYFSQFSLILPPILSASLSFLIIAWDMKKTCLLCSVGIRNFCLKLKFRITNGIGKSLSTPINLILDGIKLMPTPT
jgi:hypothetical protein